MWHIGQLMTVYKLVKLIHNFTLPTPCHSQSLQEPWLCSWRGQLLLTLPGTLSSWHDGAQTLHTIPSHSWQAPGVFKLLLKVLFCSQPSMCSQLSQASGAYHKHVLLMMEKYHLSKVVARVPSSRTCFQLL